jgi:hypothetical protein
MLIHRSGAHTSEELKDTAVEADNLSREIVCLLEELSDLLVDIDDVDIDDDIPEEVKVLLYEVECMAGNISRWRASLTSKEDEPAQASASP